MSFKRFMLCLATLSVYGYTVMIGCGPYTQLFDPNKKPPEPKPEIITPIRDDALPNSRKEYYAERLARDRYYGYTAWDRYTGRFYQPYETERYIYVDTRTVPQPTQVAPVTAPQPVRPTQPYNAERAAEVWQKRTNPRDRQAPKPTKKGE